VKYSIITINDKRKYYKDQIRQHVGLEEERIVSVDGSYMNRDGLIESHLDDLGLWISSQWPLSLGEIGVWMSNLLHWERVAVMDEPLVVFEDDAVIDAHFSEHMNTIVSQLPDDWDFVALWVPDNQRIDYRYNLRYNEHGTPEIYGMRPEGLPSFFDFGSRDLARVYQGYGMVAMMYSPAGGRKLAELAKKYGLRNPVDCFIFEEAHKGALNGFAPKPDKVFVSYDWPETTIHNTEMYK
jgi:GR25 family glycosyltransferase involved in LPS biosynthesis